MYRIIRYILVSIAVLSVCRLSAQSSDALSTYTPYSMFGFGDIFYPGTTQTYSMGGIGAGIRDRRFINIVNPASITERDTLSFMFDIGGFQKNIINTDGSSRNAYNAANMQNIVLSTPIYRKSALVAGIIPFSNVGYSIQRFETDPDIISQVGDVTYKQYGSGSVNEVFLGAAVDLFKGFSLGVHGIYYFGSINRYSNVYFNTNDKYNSLISRFTDNVGAFSFKAGLQYSADMGKEKEYNLTLGLVYDYGTSLSCTSTAFVNANNVNSSDTLAYSSSSSMINMPHEFTGGVSFSKKDKWKVGFDYIMQDWSGTEFPEVKGVDFRVRNAQSFRAGFEITPSRYDLRYYMNRCTYRVGAYYNQTYISIDGKGVDAYGITFGMSFPVFRLNNSINFSVDFGQRGDLNVNRIMERYVMFHFSISLHDIWFHRPKYE